MQTRNLSYLLAPWVPHTPHRTLREMRLDSRSVLLDDLFVAVHGHSTNGHHFISQAINQGAAAVIAETTEKRNHGKINHIQGIPVIYIMNLSHCLSAIAGRFYQNPSQKLTLIGVTGTNGKTTTTHLLAQWVQLLGYASAVMGTLGNGLYGKLWLTKNTTDSAVDVQRTLRSLFNHGAQLVGMEVSSHALTQHRVAAIHFAAVAFTNLSHDHLDYHENMQNYEYSKWKLFSQHQVGQIIINSDNPVGNKWLKMLPSAVYVTTKSDKVKGFKKWLQAIKITYYDDGASVYFNSSWGNGCIDTNLIGSFNISNLCISLATLLSLEYPLDMLINTAGQLQPITGRMQTFSVLNKPKVVVDYAHTPDALEKVLIALRHYCKGALWCVFGCGGDRDKGKRPLMGKIAEQLADIIVITSDNPRNEDPYHITDEILSGLLTPGSAYVMIDRTQAISYAIRQAQLHDVVLIAGKGSENYQIFSTQNVSYSDLNLVLHLLRTLN
ncbi:UDP-N-acetylmuramoyl-L-alanyl-D-glutamate--2, 6-diaminopimelate ligase [Candidatus Erwinia haradaeae]|uniref:UDP-N-acetylmuramoyl-L-alanyl-D-glutamate--2,6-diaminopimelate ligase n=1 Tax=Candidatus Erwinia haradaeae TaxID=1922217 RepID=A0A451DD22_9GAMM|nr:UDP-N-acetylmuramoyl-L-alanyl-D-glutamate--2,6-diaminopimelate ligase [Candidatus Erwinia haradaeae]VFP84306.1 UDP-N-acetylmuramoyl-L-alanyl-D-glutamate--2, 6-diaminopimelate ligase [Candidatus Erwinia haradaeae]